jgi:cystathionine beta-lyase
VYYPFTKAVVNNGRNLVQNPLIMKNGRYVMDYEGLEQAIDAKTAAIIVSSPHNPVGRVWEKGELERLVDICFRHGLVIISDEIHSDLVLGKTKHTCIASLSEKAAEITVTLTAPNKTFNIAGLMMGNAIISNKRLRNAFAVTVEKSGIEVSNIFGNVALEAAYDHGEAWLEELLDYLRGNIRMVNDRIAKNMPELSVSPLEGTYLAWIDCRKLGLSDAGLKDFFLKKARIWLDEGTKFGYGGSGFMRLNIACPRSTLDEVLSRMEHAIAELRR